MFSRMKTTATVRGFHDGERRVQRRAGVEAEASRLTGMLAPADLRGGLGLFLAGRTYAAMSARDADGRLWVSSLTGAPGFLAPTGTSTLDVHAAPAPGDPLHDLPAGQPVGMLVIEYAARRRVRLNGTLVTVGPDRLVLDLAEAYGNCPQYIPPRTPHVSQHSDLAEARPSPPSRCALVGSVDTFVLGTTHPERGNDASHRGGAPGFLRAESATPALVWEDLPGQPDVQQPGQPGRRPDRRPPARWTGHGSGLHLSGPAEVVWRRARLGHGTRQVVFEVAAAIG